MQMRRLRAGALRNEVRPFPEDRRCPSKATRSRSVVASRRRQPTRTGRRCELAFRGRAESTLQQGGRAVSGADQPSTRVELLHLEGRIERWIRFGRVSREDILDRRSRAVWFAAGEVFAFVRWAAGDFGTVISRIDILRACEAGEALTTVPWVDPGADVLLRVHGWSKVQRVLSAIDQVEALRIDAADACPDHWRHVHARLAVAEEPRDYTAERHTAWLSRKRIAP